MTTNPQTRRGGIRLADVAVEAGVSVATASKALNDKPGVSATTRNHVQQVAKHMGFQPNIFAQALNSPHSGTVGVLSMTLDSRWVLPIMLGIEDAFGADSTAVLLCNAERDQSRLRHRIDTLITRRVDGLVVIADSTDAQPSLTSSVTVPVVYVYGHSSDPNDVSLVPDNVMAGRLVAEHLIESGHRRLAFVGGDSRYAAAHDRAQGMNEALRICDLELVGRRPLFGNWTEQWGRSATTALLDSKGTVDAIVGGSDGVARGVLDVLRARSLRVPQDVAVAGFDNWDNLATQAWPPLTSIDMQLRMMGTLAARELILKLGGGGSEPGVRHLPVQLVTRESTARIL